MQITGPLTDGGHRDWSAPGSLAAFEADCARERAITAAAGKTPIERATEKMRVASRVRSIVAIRNAARLYLRQPWKLDAIERGLSHLEPRGLVLRCEAAVERADRPSAFVQIVPVRPINARGALLMARWLRRFGERDVTLVAAE